MSFEPEAYYWFMYPLVAQLHEQHDKFFDLWDGCEFKSDELHLFRTLIDDVEALLAREPETFSVHVGRQTKPIEEELYIEVKREEYESFLATLRSIAKECEQAEKSLHVYGD